MSFELQTKSVKTTDGHSEVKYFSCKPLEEAGFKNAFSTRQGGVSPFPEKSLNLAYRRDSESNVDENRKRFFEALGDLNPRVYTNHQMHSDRLTVLSGDILAHLGPRPGDEPEGDALIAREGGIWLGVKIADCTPLLIGDPQKGLMAAVHAGWKGTLNRIAEKSVQRLKRQFGVDLANLIVALGPSACAECYEVGADVAMLFKKEFPDMPDVVSSKSDGKFKIDIPAINVRQLVAQGVHPARIHVSSHCTIHQNDVFFSHRKESNANVDQVGRMLAVIGKFG